MMAQADPGGDTLAARSALRRVSRWVADLLRPLPDLERPSALPGRSVGDVGLHLVGVLRVSPGEPGQVSSGERLGQLVTDAAEEFLAGSEGQPSRHPPALLLGEAMCHGLDIARGLGRPWPVDQGDARLVLERAFPEMLPARVSSRAIEGVDLTYELRLRGAGTWSIVVRDGAVRMESGDRLDYVDCHISAEPAAMLLVGYGRMPVSRALWGGRIVAYGRRPWTALRLGSLLAPSPAGEGA